MKKIFVAMMSLMMILTVSACSKEDQKQKDDQQEVENPTDDKTTISAENVISHAEYVAAAIDTKVTVEAYVQNHQSWWDGKITVYAQDEEGGAYFFYNMACSEEEATKLVAGTKIRVEGFKSEWAGEVEIIDANFEIIEGNYIAEAKDLTDKLGSDELIDYQNVFAAFKGLTVEPSINANNEEVAFLYGSDGNGSNENNSDLYFNVSYNGQTYTFCVESYLCGNDTDVYAAVEALNIGDVIDCEGFLYWYEGANPHITSVTVK